MNSPAIAVALLLALMTVSGPAVRAQPGYMRSPEPKKEEPKPAAEKKPQPRRAKAMGTDKQTIEAYLQGRLGQLAKAHRAQESFGRKLSGSWTEFWGKVFKERKLFEVRIARQRLDLFESLGSLDPSAHGATIADYERLQSNQLKAFEDSQRQRMTEFFDKMMAEVRDFSMQQERARQEFLAQALDVWQQQKAGK